MAKTKLILEFTLVDGDIGWETTTPDEIYENTRTLVDYNGAIRVVCKEVPRSWVQPAKGA